MCCKDCKYWKEGACQAVGLHDKGFGWNQNPEVLFDIAVDVLDDSGLDYRLLTGPEFGCVRFVSPNAVNQALTRERQ